MTKIGKNAQNMTKNGFKITKKLPILAIARPPGGQVDKVSASPTVRREDSQGGRQSGGKTVRREASQGGMQSGGKTVRREDSQEGRQSEGKTVRREGSQEGRQSGVKTVKREDSQEVRQSGGKTVGRTVTTVHGEGSMAVTWITSGFHKHRIIAILSPASPSQGD